jgi:hypothetical protein
MRSNVVITKAARRRVILVDGAEPTLQDHTDLTHESARIELGRSRKVAGRFPSAQPRLPK